jgi:hypothetical protein
MTKRDRVDPDTALGIFDRERFGRVIQAALGQRRQNGRNRGPRVIDEARNDLNHSVFDGSDHPIGKPDICHRCWKPEGVISPSAEHGRASIRFPGWGEGVFALDQ